MNSSLAISGLRFLCASADTDFGKEAQYMIPVDSAPYYGISRTIRVSTICTGVG